MNARLAFLLIAASLALTACGNKGSLVLPDKLDETSVPATPADPAPTDAPPTGETPPETIDAPAEEVAPVPPPEDDD